MSSRFDQQLAEFLKKEQGEMSYTKFAKKLGISPSSLHRLRHGDQSATLNRLHQILARLKCTLRDVFPDDV